LLGSHVARCTEHRTAARQLARVTGVTREPEVEQHHVVDAPPAQEQVRRLQIAVHHAVLVRDGEPRQRRAYEAHAVAQAERLAREPLGDVLAVEPLHRQIRHPLRRRAMRDVGHDRRM
jgi:hypothetical protein